MTGLTGNRDLPEDYEYMTSQNDQEIFRDQIFNERISSMYETRFSMLESCLLELTARKLRWFVLKTFKILKL